MMALKHSGVAHDDGPPGRGSGRYGWGTGKNPGQHQFTFLSEVNRLKRIGLKDAEIAKMLLGDKATTTTLRAEISIQKAEQRKMNRERALKVVDECNGNISEAARKLGMKSESSLRSLLDTTIAERQDRYRSTADMLKKVVDEKGIVDISKGTELYLGVNRHTFDVAVAMLEKEGYLKSWADIPQLGTTHDTTLKVMAKPGITHGEIQKNKYDIAAIREFTPDEGKTWWTPEKPVSVNSDRVFIRYAEEGGKEKDGVIELRRGVEDISLGGSQYAQVRIGVDDSHYMKGMAMYGDIPKGYDIVYNTNKSKGTPKEKVFKEMKHVMKDGVDTGEVDWENPFGALIKSPNDRDGVLTAGGQRKYIGKDGKEHLSPINKLQDEGDWNTWSRTLSSQFLSKQPVKLINQQIDLSVKSKTLELDEIKRLTNPVIKKQLLNEFADSCDSNASSLSVKGFKGQAYQVILPVPEMKPNEIYAPNFKDGDTVALIRYPHAYLGEIPVLKVNNKVAAAKKVMNNAKDAVGINSKVADQMSGADFDGDFTIVIPKASNRLDIKYSKPIDALVNFDNKALYKLPDSAPTIKSQTKQKEMGIITNLITDMTASGATDGDIVRAVRHSMVVIDSEKHHLDYKQSAKDHNIQDLKVKYQTNPVTGKVGGASTIFSRASSETRVKDRKEITDVKKMTPEEVERWNNGKKVYRDTNETIKKVITDPSKMTAEELKLHQAGKKVYRDTGEYRTIKITRMDAVDDAMSLVNDKTNAKEVAYANYANSLKGLADDARKEARNIKPTPVSKEAKTTYSKEVDSLNEKLRTAQSNAPKERRAQMIANQRANERIKSNPDLDFEHRQRIKSQELMKARAEVGAKKQPVDITDREWDAIQAGAISTQKLTDILSNTNTDAVKKKATPKQNKNALTDAQLLLAKSMLASGMYTQAEIAEKFGVSPSTISAIA